MPIVLEQTCTQPYDCGYTSVQTVLLADMAQAAAGVSVNAAGRSVDILDGKMGGKGERKLGVPQSVCDNQISACHVYGSGDGQYMTPFDLWEAAYNC